MVKMGQRADRKKQIKLSSDLQKPLSCNKRKVLNTGLVDSELFDNTIEKSRQNEFF